MPPTSLPATAKKNIKTIAQVEQELLGRRSRVERLGDAIALFFGSLRFITAHALFLAAWIAINLGAFPSIRPFDRYPFPLLGLIVGVEFILLTAFVLMNQSLQSRRQEQWAHLSIQLCMLTEQEVTKNMQMLHLICRHLGLEAPTGDGEIKEMSQPTPVSTLVEEIEKVREVGNALVKARSEERQTPEWTGDDGKAHPSD